MIAILRDLYIFYLTDMTLKLTKTFLQFIWNNFYLFILDFL